MAIVTILILPPHGVGQRVTSRSRAQMRYPKLNPQAGLPEWNRCAARDSPNFKQLELREASKAPCHLMEVCRMVPIPSLSMAGNL